MQHTAQTGLDKLHKTELDLAKEFAAICDRNGLMYFMLGGTMLGAIRHKGFIPWDDDMDFAMFRNDYEKFVTIAPKELPRNIKMVNFRNTPNYQYYFLRIEDTETRVIEERIGNDSKDTYVSIDIFPIDGTPNNGIVRKIYFFRVLCHRAIMSMYYKDSIDKKRKRNFAEKCLISFLDKLPISKVTTGHKQMEKIDKIMKKQKTTGSRYIGNLMGAYRTKEIVPAEFFGEGQMYMFEDTEFRGLVQYDEYLKSQYGDYMKLPQEEERERKTHYKVIELHGEKIEEPNA